MPKKEIYVINMNSNSNLKWVFLEFDISKKNKTQSDGNFIFKNVNWEFDSIFNRVGRKNFKLRSKYAEDIYEKILERFWFEFVKFKDIYENETTILLFVIN